MDINQILGLIGGSSDPMGLARMTAGRLRGAPGEWTPEVARPDIVIPPPTAGIQPSLAAPAPGGLPQAAAAAIKPPAPAMALPKAHNTSVTNVAGATPMQDLRKSVV